MEIILVESEIYNQTQLVELIQQVGFLPLLYCGIRGFSAEEVVSDECRYMRFSDGGWGWSLLTTPKQLYGKESCQCQRNPEASFERLLSLFKHILPKASEKEILKLLK